MAQNSNVRSPIIPLLNYEIFATASEFRHHYARYLLRRPRRPRRRRRRR